MKDFKTVKVFNDSVEANMAKDFLAENGIESFISDEYVGEIFINVVQGIKLNVLAEDYEKALELLTSLPDMASDKGEDSGVVGILEESEALLSGHFKLTSGLHSDKYIEKIRVIQYPDKVAELCTLLTKKLSGLKPDIVVGLAMGGIALGYEVAKQMETKFVFTQRKDGEMSIRSGFQIEKGMKAIIIEDIVTTGGSVFEVIELLKRKGIEVIAIGLLVDRSGGKVDFGVRTETLLSIEVKAYQPEECPLCEDNVPLTTPGSSDKKTLT